MIPLDLPESGLLIAYYLWESNKISHFIRRLYPFRKITIYDENHMFLLKLVLK